MKLLKLLPLFILVSTVSAENILFIGNGYTEEIKSTLTTLFTKQSAGAKVEFIHPAGKNLLFHTDNVNTMKTINNGDWDKIVLQEDLVYSAHPEKVKDFQKAAAEFTKFFRSLKKQPKIYYLVASANRDGVKKFPNVLSDYSTMQDLIVENCSKVASANKASIVPVGQSFKELKKKYPDFFTNLYKEDGSLPSNVGSYLAACVIYGTIINGAPVMSIKWFADLDPENAIEIRIIAKKIIDQHE